MFIVVISGIMKYNICVNIYSELLTVVGQEAENDRFERSQLRLPN